MYGHHTSGRKAGPPPAQDRMHTHILVDAMVVQTVGVPLRGSVPVANRMADRHLGIDEAPEGPATVAPLGPARAVALLGADLNTASSQGSLCVLAKVTAARSCRSARSAAWFLSSSEPRRPSGPNPLARAQ
jgi:hypothetical protein